MQSSGISLGPEPTILLVHMAIKVKIGLITERHVVKIVEPVEHEIDKVKSVIGIMWF